MAMKGYSTFPKGPALPKPRYQIVWYHIHDARWGRVLSFLLRCSRYILQPQPTRLYLGWLFRGKSSEKYARRVSTCPFSFWLPYMLECVMFKLAHAFVQASLLFSCSIEWKDIWSKCSSSASLGLWFSASMWLLWAPLALDRGPSCIPYTGRLSIICGLGCTFSMFHLCTL